MFLNTLVSALVISLTGAQAYYVKLDSCVPSSSTFATVRSPVQCLISSERLDAIIWDCDGQGEVQLNVAANTLHMVLSRQSQAHSLTIHGRCIKNGGQVAHLDLHVGATANQDYNHKFPAFNRLCDDRGTGAQMEFYAYKLNSEQMTDCAKHPIKQIP